MDVGTIIEKNRGKKWKDFDQVNEFCVLVEMQR